MNNLKVENSKKFYDDVSYVQKELIKVDGNGILGDIAGYVESLRTSFTSLSSVIQINNMVKAHNAIVDALNPVIVYLTRVGNFAYDLLKIEISNGANISTPEEFTGMTFNDIPELTGDNLGQDVRLSELIPLLDTMNGTYKELILLKDKFENYYSTIFNNWLDGSDRDEAASLYSNAITALDGAVADYKKAYDYVSTAINNYN